MGLTAFATNLQKLKINKIGIVACLVYGGHLITNKSINMQYRMTSAEAILHKPHPLVYLGLTQGKVIKSRVVNPQGITNILCRELKIKLEDLLTNSRAKRIVKPRQIAMYILRVKAKMTVVEIGKFFDKDHTTVVYAVSKVYSEMHKNETFKNFINSLSDKIVLDKDYYNSFK